MTNDPTGYDEEDDEIPARSRWWIWIVAAVLVVSLAIAYGADAFFRVAPSVLRSSGDPDSYEFLQTDPATGGPVRYNPCEPIRYVIDRRDAPEGAIDDLDDGIAMFEEAMGIEMVFEGYTNEPATSDRPVYQPDRYGEDVWAPLLFAWVPRAELLQPDDQAVGAAGSAYVQNEDGELVYVTGVVTFNSEAKLLPGFELGGSWGDVVLHELGHLFGLGHVNDTTQVMHPNVTTGEARLGAGDLAGLEKLGRKAGCVEVPDPL